MSALDPDELLLRRLQMEHAEQALRRRERRRSPQAWWFADPPRDALS